MVYFNWSTLLSVLYFVNSFPVFDGKSYRGYDNANLYTSYVNHLSLETKVGIKVYYEMLCPYCRQFIVDQLKPTMEKLGPYIDLRLVPYGNAKSTFNEQGYSFACQHGPQECIGNILQACAIQQFGNSTRSALFVACVMDSYKPLHKDTNYRLIARKFHETLAKCQTAQNYKPALISNIESCYNSGQGAELLYRYGLETKEQRLHGVPAILVDNSWAEQQDARVDLARTVCLKLRDRPNVCDAYFTYSHNNWLNVY